MTLRFTRQAIASINQAAEHYGLLGPQLANKFRDDVESACRTVEAHPEARPVINARHGTRRTVTLHFNYLIYYEFLADEWTVLDVINSRRRRPVSGRPRLRKL